MLVAFLTSVRKPIGMHIHYDVIVEIVDPDSGRVLPEGEPGEVVVTCNNKTYPLVRFGTGDLSSIINDDCPCGRMNPKVNSNYGQGGSGHQSEGNVCSSIASAKGSRCPSRDIQGASGR